MRQIRAILVLSLLMACNSTSKKEVVNTVDSKTKSVVSEETKPMASGDYSSLLSNFKCDMAISEVTRALKVPETDLSISDNTKPDKCFFNLKGFGENTGGDVTQIFWGTYPSAKGQNKKEIKNYLKNQEEYPAKVIQYMSIALAETNDCYIAQQPAHGRVIIYNENYDTAFILNYGRRGAFKRTEEQHEELKSKMTDLANYLVMKHRK